MPKIWPFEFWLLVGASWLKTQKYNRYGPNWAVSCHGCLAQHCPTLHGPVDMPDHAGPGSLAHFSSLLGANICLGKLTISPQRFSLCYVFRSIWKFSLLGIKASSVPHLLPVLSHSLQCCIPFFLFILLFFPFRSILSWVQSTLLVACIFGLMCIYFSHLTSQVISFWRFSP